MTVAALAIVVASAGCAVGNGTAQPSAGPAHSGPTPPPGFALVGSWTTTITRADLEAGGITDPGTLNENAGQFTWTFEPDGTWRSVQVSLDDAPVMNPVFAGFYLVEDSAVVAVTEFPEEYRDTGLRYGYVVIPGSGVQFSLANPPDPVLKIITEAHPWLPVGS